MNDLEKMKEAYGMFFVIESKLRQIILTNLINNYGYTHLVKRYLAENQLYRNLIEYFQALPHVLPHFDAKQLSLLSKLTPIRNKIAHSHMLTDNEFNHLTKCYRLVKRQPITKRKN
ncbi:hypothetical protein H1D32_13470 [Anaerobacillus sp. CMMVII]|uniref:hypothetical protein n=1 Tax=Anaerobacillus sp. CMMVII TaxID=2755588 RepID=UPI0021B7D57B|nr:hypothetical protein [Anaerobacillus sp. CMMVII]MCT8138664.1 hypothetical protein [Anaerobacillus sp. CMMVII]